MQAFYEIRPPESDLQDFSSGGIHLYLPTIPGADFQHAFVGPDVKPIDIIPGPNFRLWCRFGNLKNLWERQARNAFDTPLRTGLNPRRLFLKLQYEPGQQDAQSRQSD